ncbi:hypothetical protein BDM02DRAFT_2389943 [Thelephora ganbajun]|uniref:Uncharacterized protein n=1 Tax=Thelephora ganbajun TaxID=370292 RepID=A0ACB6ZUU4_THEGA|nr:hypothetical protein BDM02DRAFT_2389943 [Thelephora ganbajun]
MHSGQPSLVTPSPMTQLLEQLALDDLPHTTPSKASLDSSTNTLTEEPGLFLSSPTRIDFPSLLSNSRDSTLMAESVASSSRQSREGSCIIPAGPVRDDPITNYPRSLHMSASSPALRRGTSILRSPSYTDQSPPASSNTSSPPSPTSPGTPSVKFAPLPEIERSKKRKHSHRLGVAARSQMLARRKQMMRDNEDPDRPPKHLWGSDDDDDDGEDPLITLGNMVKLASIGIWRKVASKDRKIRPGMQERSNSDSVLEVTRAVTYADDEDANEALFDRLATDTSDDKPSLPQIDTLTKAVDDGMESHCRCFSSSSSDTPTARSILCHFPLFLPTPAP